MSCVPAVQVVDRVSENCHAPLRVRAIRLRAGLTQAEFAARFGFSLTALRHWEQGTRTPEGPTRAYLCVIARDPEAVERALRPLGEKSRS